MKNVLEKATAHWETIKSGTVEIPEWGEKGAPLIGHFDRLTFEESEKVQREAKGDNVLASVKLIIERLKDEAGARIFDDDPATFHALRHKVDPQIIERIVRVILRVSTEAEAAKN